MPIQRSYNLPSCTLQVEGISTEGSDRLSILTGFECKFHHNGDKISGERELLDILIKSTGKYAQALQSAEPVLVDSEFLSLEPVNAFIHKLKVKASDRSESSESIEINLNTVQLFDLVESIDRLCLDPQTSLDLNPAIEPTTSSTKNAVSYLPAFIGVGSLAIVSTILFLIPTPKPDPKPQPQPVSSISTQVLNLM
jgi:hypothetical protein